MRSYPPRFVKRLQLRQFNMGNGTFAPMLNYDAGTDTYAVATADLNSDGRPDLVAAVYYSNSVTVLLNTCHP